MYPSSASSRQVNQTQPGTRPSCRQLARDFCCGRSAASASAICAECESGVDRLSGAFNPSNGHLAPPSAGDLNEANW